MTEIIDGVTYTVIDCDQYDQGNSYKDYIGTYPNGGNTVTSIDGEGSDTTLPNAQNKFIFTKSAWLLHGSPANVYIKNFEVLGPACFRGTNVEQVYLGNTIRNQTGATGLSHAPWTPCCWK